MSAGESIVPPVGAAGPAQAPNYPSGSSGGRVRAYFQFIVAVLYFFLARALARHGAEGLAGEQWGPLVEQAMLAFLLVVGYAGFGFWFDRQDHPIRSQGFPQRAGAAGELGTGLAFGWALAVICVLPMVVIGGIVIYLTMEPSAWGWLVADAAYFALLALVEEAAFRGYAFQRFEHSVGGLGAAIGFAAYYAIVQSTVRGSDRASIAVSIALGLLLSTAYLRTRALWLSWGLNFGWKASRALLFGLAVSGTSGHSPVVQGDPMGPFWLTGGGYGLDSSWVAFAVLLASIPVLFRVTRDLDYKYNAPVLVPGGIAVDLDAAAKRQHEAAMGIAEPAAPGLVQIAPVVPMPFGGPRQSGQQSGADVAKDSAGE
jgi:membrane protease YdiL (CAAX protease family)